MTNDWMIDVLADLRAFAGKNGLPMLEQELGKALNVAAEELNAQSCVVAFVGAEGHDRPRELPRKADAFQDAG